MKYLIILSVILAVAVSGCTQSVQEATTVSTTILTTSIETTLAATTIGPTTIQLGAACNDTDGGIVYSVKGIATYPRAPVGLTRDTDKCISNITLQEVYCKSVSGRSYQYEIASVRRTCAVACIDGACVNETSEAGAITGNIVESSVVANPIAWLIDFLIKIII